MNINHNTKSVQAFEIMRDLILNGTWEPGFSIKIRETAKLLGISEMPVREAVRTLVENGLAVHRPHRGAVVSELSVKEIQDFYRVRILLEGEAAKLGAEQINDKQLKVMKQHWTSLKKVVDAGNVIEALNIDADFLTALYESSGNRELVNLIQSFWNRVQPYRILWASRSKEKSSLVIWKYKPMILEAAERKDGELAKRLTIDSLLEAEKELEKLLMHD